MVHSIALPMLGLNFGLGDAKQLSTASVFHSFFYSFSHSTQACMVHSTLNIILGHILIFTFAPFSMANKFMHLMEELLVLSPFTTMICSVRDTPFVHCFCRVCSAFFRSVHLRAMCTLFCIFTYILSFNHCE